MRIEQNESCRSCGASAEYSGVDAINITAPDGALAESCRPVVTRALLGWTSISAMVGFRRPMMARA